VPRQGSELPIPPHGVAGGRNDRRHRGFGERAWKVAKLA
jgi:hypothetical protein